jgi:SMC interacting uncharacterized protein involved in chromosome segregation
MKPTSDDAWNRFMTAIKNIQELEEELSKERALRVQAANDSQIHLEQWIARREEARQVIKEKEATIEKLLARIDMLEREDRIKTDTDAACAIAAETTIEKLKQIVAILTAGLWSIARNTCCDRCQEAALVAKAALDAASREDRP